MMSPCYVRGQSSRLTAVSKSRLTLAAPPAGFPALLGGRRAAAAAARTVVLAALVLGIDRPPGPLFGFLPGHALVAITFLDVLSLALLLGGVRALRHDNSPSAAKTPQAPMGCGCRSAAFRLGARFEIQDIANDSPQRGDHRSRRPWQDHARRPALPPVGHLPRQPAGGRARHGF